MKNSKRQRYFRKQKFIGIIGILISILSIMASKGNIVLAVLIMPMSICMVFSKDMWITDRYYYEVEQEKERQEMEA